MPSNVAATIDLIERINAMNLSQQNRDDLIALAIAEAKVSQARMMPMMSSEMPSASPSNNMQIANGEEPRMMEAAAAASAPPRSAPSKSASAPDKGKQAPAKNNGKQAPMASAGESSGEEEKGGRSNRVSADQRASGIREVLARASSPLSAHQIGEMGSDKGNLYAVLKSMVDSGEVVREEVDALAEHGPTRPGSKKVFVYSMARAGEQPTQSRAVGEKR